VSDVKVLETTSTPTVTAGGTARYSALTALGLTSSSP